MSHKVSLWSMFLFEGEKSILHKETVFSWPHVTKPSDANMKRQWGKTYLSVWYLGSLYQDNTPEQKKKKNVFNLPFLPVKGTMSSKLKEFWDLFCS